MKLLPFCTWLPCLLLLFFGLCPVGRECGAVSRRTARSKREVVRAREAAGSVPGACGTRLPRGKRAVAAPERRAAAESGAGSGRSAVYFTGRGDQLRLKPSLEVPRGNFTLEMWTKPEGGQRSPTVIAGPFCRFLSWVLVGLVWVIAGPCCWFRSRVLVGLVWVIAGPCGWFRSMFLGFMGSWVLGLGL